MGIDQSYTSTGYCIGTTDGELGLSQFGLISSIKTDDIFSRARYIATEICILITKYNVDYVALEGLAFGARGDATRNLAGLQFTIVNNIYTNQNQKGCEIYAPGTIKKIATGKGNSPKTLLLDNLPDGVRSQFDATGVKKSTGLLDLVDAYWILQTLIVNKTD